MPKSAETQLRRYHQLVQTLASLARNSHEVEAVVQAVHQQAGTLFAAQATLLALREPDGDWRWELYEEERRYTQRLPFSPDGIIETVLAGEALSIPDLDTYLEEHPVHVRRVLDVENAAVDIHADEAQDEAGPPTRSMLFVPLDVRGKRAGVLSIQSYEARAFDDTDLEFLHLLAQHVSIALENAALREELAQLTRTDALTGLLNRRAFSHDVPEALNTAQREGRELSSGDARCPRVQADQRRVWAPDRRHGADHPGAGVDANVSRSRRGLPTQRRRVRPAGLGTRGAAGGINDAPDGWVARCRLAAGCRPDLPTGWRGTATAGRGP